MRTFSLVKKKMRNFSPQWKTPIRCALITTAAKWRCIAQWSHRMKSVLIIAAVPSSPPAICAASVVPCRDYRIS